MAPPTRNCCAIGQPITHSYSHEYNFSRPVCARRVTRKLPLGSTRVRSLPYNPHTQIARRFSRPPRFSTMKAESQRSTKGQEGALSELNTTIETLNLAKDASDIAPAKALFGSVSIILATIRVSFLPVFVDRLQSKMDPGQIDQAGGLRRTWARLR